VNARRSAEEGGHLAERGRIGHLCRQSLPGAAGGHELAERAHRAARAAANAAKYLERAAFVGNSVASSFETRW
jgi:hypothetical protein